MFYAVFEWTDRHRGWYDLADAVGSRVFKSERGATAFKATVESTSCLTTERGYVVRDSNYIRELGGMRVAASGRLEMAIPCSCRQAHIDTDPACPYHTQVLTSGLGRLLS